jgi:hypothetical protein
MFTWICPKCGSEVPPSENECPTCRARANAAASGAATPPAVVPPGAQEPPSTTTGPSPSSDAISSQPVVIAPPPSFGAAPAPTAVPKASTLSPALVALISAVGIVVLLAILYLFVLPKGVARSPAVTMERPGPAAPNIATAHPLAKYIEVTGLRIAEGGPGQAKIIFAAVNHSSADLPELDAHMTLTGGGKTVFEFPVTVPSIGPYESKDVTTTVKTGLKPYEMPDWQTLTPALRIIAER